MSLYKLHLQTVVDQLFAENTYLAYLDHRDDCLVVDPGLEPDRIVAALKTIDRTPSAILNTHGHSDHIAGNEVIKQHWPQAPVVIGEQEANKLLNPEANLSAQFGVPIISPAADILLNEPDQYSAAGFDLDVLFTPGHSSGHIVYVWREHKPWVVFGGDVLFQNSIGRTDFVDGSFEQLKNSIHEKLFSLPDDTIVLPGHGPSTTVGEEKQSNPFVGIGS